jgi:hypothetical protein
MQDSASRPRSRRRRGALVHALVAGASLGLVGCESESFPFEEKDAVYAKQDGASVAEGGVGVMGGVEAGVSGLDPSEIYISIQSHQAKACEQLSEYVPLEPGFGWYVGLILPARDLAAGTAVSFGPEDGRGFSEAFYEGSDGWSGGDGFACGDDPYDRDESVTGEILSVLGDTLTLRIDNLCFIDYGPIIPEDELGNPIEYDDPADDVLVRADGIYTIQLCGSL